MVNHPLRDLLNSSGPDVDECADEITFGGHLAIRSKNLESDFHVCLLEGIKPCPHHNLFSHIQLALELDVEDLLVPVPAALQEFFHRHAIAAPHLVVAGKEHVVEVLRAVDMVVHIDVVRADDELGVETFIRHDVDLRLRNLKTLCLCCSREAHLWLIAPRFCAIVYSNSIRDDGFLVCLAKIALNGQRSHCPFSFI